MSKRKPKTECQVRGCHVDQEDRPAIFRGEPYCSDNHRKILVKQGKIEGKV